MEQPPSLRHPLCVLPTIEKGWAQEIVFAATMFACYTCIQNDDDPGAATAGYSQQ